MAYSGAADYSSGAPDVGFWEGGDPLWVSVLVAVCVLAIIAIAECTGSVCSRRLLRIGEGGDEPEHLLGLHEEDALLLRLVGLVSLRGAGLHRVFFGRHVAVGREGSLADRVCAAGLL